MSLVLASESRRKGIQWWMRPGHFFGSMLHVPLPLIPKEIFWNKWSRKTLGKLAGK